MIQQDQNIEIKIVEDVNTVENREQKTEPTPVKHERETQFGQIPLGVGSWNRYTSKSQRP